jgi:hypothetical protein
MGLLSFGASVIRSAFPPRWPVLFLSPSGGVKWAVIEW